MSTHVPDWTPSARSMTRSLMCARTPRRGSAKVADVEILPDSQRVVSRSTTGGLRSWRMSGSVLGAKSRHTLQTGRSPRPRNSPRTTQYTAPTWLFGIVIFAVVAVHLRDRQVPDELRPAVRELTPEPVRVEDERAPLVGGVVVLVDPDQEERVVLEARRRPRVPRPDRVHDARRRVADRDRSEIDPARGVVRVVPREGMGGSRPGGQAPDQKEEAIAARRSPRRAPGTACARGIGSLPSCAWQATYPARCAPSARDATGPFDVRSRRRTRGRARTRTSRRPGRANPASAPPPAEPTRGGGSWSRPGTSLPGR